jgi:hypothetical protein
VDVYRRDVDVSRLPPPRRRAVIGTTANEPHESSRDEESQDEGDQATQQR